MPTAFGEAVAAATYQQVPSELRASATISTRITEVSRLAVYAGSQINLADGADRVTLATTAQTAACVGIDGECTAVLDGRRRRALQSTLGQAMVDVTRIYAYETSVSANASLESLVTPALSGIGSSFAGLTTLQLLAQPSVTLLGAPDASDLDEAFVTLSVLEAQLALRLPGVAYNMTVATVVQPPHPPPPPNPFPSPPAGGMSAEAVWLTILLTLLGVICVFYAWLAYTAKQRKLAAKGGARSRTGGDLPVYRTIIVGPIKKEEDKPSGIGLQNDDIDHDGKIDAAVAYVNADSIFAGKLFPGDEILSVNGEPVKGDAKKAALIIRRASKVTIVVLTTRESESGLASLIQRTAGHALKAVRMSKSRITAVTPAVPASGARARPAAPEEDYAPSAASPTLGEQTKSGTIPAALLAPPPVREAPKLAPIGHAARVAVGSTHGNAASLPSIGQDAKSHWDIVRHQPWQALRFMMLGIQEEPVTSELGGGFAAGGGVRLHPPFLEDLTQLDSAATTIQSHFRRKQSNRLVLQESKLASAKRLL